MHRYWLAKQAKMTDKNRFFSFPAVERDGWTFKVSLYDDKILVMAGKYDQPKTGTVAKHHFIIRQFNSITKAQMFVDIISNGDLIK